jgi:xylan 1,4-beta-xylosidase
MRHVAAGLEIIAGFPALRQHEVILSECDPDGWAAGSIRENPNLFYRNTEYYASYVASAACQLLAAGHPQGPRVDGMLTWAFQFEDREAFAGLRTLSTQGVDKPVLSVFRLLATIGGAMVDLTSNGARDPVAQGRGDLPGDPPNVSGIASVDALGILRLFLVSHHDDWDVTGHTELRVRIAGLDKDTRYEAKQIRIDGDHANAHTAWTHLGKPAWPSEAQLVRLREASRLRSTPLGQIETEDGLLSLSLTLPTHGICLVELQPVWQPSEI